LVIVLLKRAGQFCKTRGLRHIGGPKATLEIIVYTMHHEEDMSLLIAAIPINGLIFRHIKMVS